MVGPEPYVPLGPHTIIKDLLYNKKRVSREGHWPQLQDMRHARLVIGGYNLSGLKIVINLPKNKFGYMSRSTPAIVRSRSTYINGSGLLYKLSVL